MGSSVEFEPSGTELYWRRPLTKTGSAGAPVVQPPPLRPFGLVLHHDGRWSHEEHPILNRKMRELFDRSVVYLPMEGKFIVKLGHFRGEIEIEEAGFFVKAIDLAQSQVHLSDGQVDRLELDTLEVSPLDGALLCRVKHDLVPSGLRARFCHSAQAELLGAVEEDQDGAGWFVVLAGRPERMPEL